jgi:tetratricopeptide (TPR) repeat protein
LPTKPVLLTLAETLATIMKKITLIIIITFCNLTLKSQVSDSSLSKAYFNQINENYNDAVALYSIILESDSTSYDALLNRGICYSMIDQNEKSLADFQKALLIKPKSGFAMIGIATISGVLEKHNMAIEYFQKALKIKIELNYTDYFNLGTAYYSLGKIDSAKHYLEHSYNLDKVNSHAVDNLAWAYLEDDPEKSCHFFNEAYLKDTLDSRKINNLGYSHLLCGNLEVAYDLFKKAEKIDPSNSFIYRNLGLYHLKKDQKEQACINLKKSIDLNIISEWGEMYIIELRIYCNKQE